MSNDQTKRKVEYRNVGDFDDFLVMGQNWLFGLNPVIPPEGRQQTTFLFLQKVLTFRKVLSFKKIM